jgi:WD40 repeat protein
VYGGAEQIQLSSLSFDRKGELLATGSTPDIIDIWDLNKRIKLRTIIGGTTVALAPDGKLLASDGISLWDITTGKELRKIPWSGDTVDQLQFSPSASQLLVASNKADLMVFEVASGRKLAVLKNSRRGQYSSDGKFIVGANYQHLLVWSAGDFTLLKDLPNGPDYVTNVAVAPNNQTVLIGGPNGTRLVRLEDGRTIASFGKGYVQSLGFSNSGKTIFTRDSGAISFWNLAGKELCSDKKIESGQAKLGPDDLWLVTGAEHQRDLLLWRETSINESCGNLIE